MAISVFGVSAFVQLGAENSAVEKKIRVVEVYTHTHFYSPVCVYNMLTVHFESGYKSKLSCEINKS